MSFSVSIILVEPQMGENIGATARAMKNFAFKDLRIVNPRDGWPNPKADSMSVGAIDIIKSAKLYDSIQSAISDLEYIYATSAALRDINKKVTPIANLYSEQVLVQGKNYGIMFGRESCGLTNAELSYANSILTIETSGFSSLNIAHAVAIVCYEIYRKRIVQPTTQVDVELSTRGEFEYFFSRLERELSKSEFFRVSEKKELMISNIRNIFARIDNLSQKELNILHGIITALRSNVNNDL